MIGEDYEVDGPNGVEIVLAEYDAELVAKLLHFGETLAGGAVAGVADYVEGAGAVVSPVGRGGGGGEEGGGEEEAGYHALILAKPHCDCELTRLP